ncbi:MAG: hypothetical protein ACN4GZ_16850 [Acidimicrobiales bacterium]
MSDLPAVLESIYQDQAAGLGVERADLPVVLYRARLTPADDGSVTIDGVAATSDFDQDQVTPEGSVAAVAFGCLHKTLEMPDRILQQFMQTRLIDGIQMASFGPFEAFWTYRGDDGWSITFYESES